MTTSRRGIALLETVIASGLLVVLVAVSLRMLSTTSAQRRAVEKRSIALAEAANVAEQISMLPWEEITTEGLGEVQLSPAASQSLPKGELKLAVEASTSGPPGLRVSIEIIWRQSSGRLESPVRLSFWTYAPSGGPTP
jgi:hypothetical protein